VDQLEVDIWHSIKFFIFLKKNSKKKRIKKDKKIGGWPIVKTRITLMFPPRRCGAVSAEEDLLLWVLWKTLFPSSNYSFFL
jgi:hypothetical protein